MSRYVDFRADRSTGACVVLPGRQYTPDGPLLFFAAQVARAHGWDVRQVWWEPAERGSRSVTDEVAWVADELDAAVDGLGGQVLVVGKSLGTLAAPRAAEHGFRAAWLTPLLTEAPIAEALLSYPADQFCAIGSEDPFLDRDLLDRLPGGHLVVPGDHVLVVPGDPVATVASHDAVVRALDTWFD